MTGIDYHLPPIEAQRSRALGEKSSSTTSWPILARSSSSFRRRGVLPEPQGLVVEDPRQLLDRRSGSDEARAVSCCLGPGVNCGFLRYARCGVARTSITSLSLHRSTRLNCCSIRVCQEALLFGCPQGTTMWSKFQLIVDRLSRKCAVRLGLDRAVAVRAFSPEVRCCA